jgi:nitroreductase
MLLAAAIAAANINAGETLKLPATEKDSGVTVMQALKARHSDREFSEREIPMEMLSGVLWAANGFNRPDKRTNATGMNKQTIAIYAIMKSGAYRYDAKANALVKVCDADLRKAVADWQDFAAKAPVSLLIVSDVSDPVYASKWNTLTHYDAGIVSGNIYLYCAANGLATVCRGTMDRDALKKALKLSDKKILHLNHPIGRPATK